MRRRENVLYAVVWTIVFAMVPILYFLQALSSGSGFIWKTVLQTWVGIIPFLVLFLAHSILATPLLDKKEYTAYSIVTVALLVLFALFCLHGGNGKPPVPSDGPPPIGGPGGPGAMPPGPPEATRPVTPEIMKIIMGILVVAVNLGIKGIFKSLRSEQKMQELRAENLGRQLEMLRYQINPHFFMNTLNNIHALVDLDPEKAKESIEEFSKLMRYVLYDGSSPTIPLERELDYLRHYVSLMRLRYPESVEIEMDLPDNAEGAAVPPLAMASLVENAFKHGISLDARSRICVSVTRENGRIIFRCENTLHGQEDPGKHGIGLENVRKRLDLMYGDTYILQAGQHEDRFSVLLVLPEKEAAL